MLLHEICHRAIHAQFNENELARRYSSIEALRDHPAIAKFIGWVATKDPAFHAPTLGPGARPGRKRR